MRLRAGGRWRSSGGGLLGYAGGGSVSARPPAGGRAWRAGGARAAGGRARFVRQQHHVAAVRECGRGSGLVMYKC